jgi:hypothetical protein
MVAVVGSVSLSLIVTTPSTAQALTARDVKAAETFVMGATKTMAPAANVAMAAASVTPVGMVFRLAQLGLLAYSTQDVWMPFVAGAWGNATGEAPSSPPASGASVYPALSTNEVRLDTDPRTGVIWASDGAASSSSSGWIGWAVNLECKNRSTNVVRATKQNQQSSNHSLASKSINISCSTNETIVGVLVGAFGSHPDLTPPTTTAPGVYKGPSNVYKWGTLLGQGSPAFDPYGADTKYKVRSECIAADGTKSTIEAESSGDYMKFPSCEAAGKGHGTGKNSVVGFAPGTTTEKPLWDSPAAPSDPATPLCDASRPTGGCVLSVEIDGKPCTFGDPECENWSEIQKNDPNNTRLKCRFGPYTLPMAQCARLEQAYRIGGAPATEENTDGNPDTNNFRTPQNTPLANPVPATTTPGTTTGTKTGTVPGSSGAPAPSSAPADQKMANCFPTGWAMLNPVEWVLKPVRCAFEPTQTQAQIQNRANGVMTLAQGKAPISFLNLELVGPSGGGCPNWTITIPGMLSENVVCGSSFTDAILSVRAPLFGLVATAMIWPLIRSLWYAAIPVLRVSPSSGGK